MTVRSLTFVCCMTLSIACSANNHIEQSEIIDYAIKAAEEAYASLNERADQCMELRESNDIPKLDNKKLAALNATRLDTLTALTYIADRNSWLCARDETLSYHFHIGALENLLKKLEIEPDSVLGPLGLLPSEINYPSKMSLEWAVMYVKLSQPKQQYFESAIGNDPFFYGKAIELNNIDNINLEYE